jgi:hypothetical protein
MHGKYEVCILRKVVSMLAEITAEKFICSSSKLHVIFHLSLPNSQCCASLGRSRYELQENPSNEIRDTAGKVLCSPIKVPFNYRDRSQPKLRHVLHFGGDGGCEFSGKSLQ